jgi:porin
MTGDWDGWRKKLVDDGLTVSPTYTGLVSGNPSGGARQGIQANGLFNIALDFDLGKMSDGAVTDLTFHTNAMYIYGPGLSPKFVGDFSNTSNIQGYNSIRVQEIWLQKEFFNQRLSVKIGNLAADLEFFQSSSSSLFLCSTFGGFTLLFTNIPTPPFYPVASPGVLVQFLPTSKTYVMSAVYGMDNSSEPESTNQHGTRFALTASSGMLIMSEVGYLLNQGPKDTGLQGTYRLGSFVDTYNYDNWGSQAHAALGTGSLQSAGANYGVYGIVDQQIYAKDNRAISVFFRASAAPSNVNLVDGYQDGGFNFTGFIPGRTNDVAGLAMAHSHISGNYSNSQVLQGYTAATEETVLEATYKAQVTPWWSIQPDFQYIMNPSGVLGSPNAVVLGVSTTVAF